VQPQRVFALKMPREMPIGAITFARLQIAVAATMAAVVALVSAGGAEAAPAPVYHFVFRPGKIVPLGDSIPHAEGVMVDRRIVPDLQYLADAFPIYVLEGYAGPLAGVGQVGCRQCHVKHSDHFNGLAADIVPIGWDGQGCDRSWRPIARLAHWAEPRQNHPRLPFRWVGYNGDYNHGCGNHLHLSWDHASAKRYKLTDWVTVFDVPGKATGPVTPPEPVEPAPPPTPPTDVPVTGRETPGA
jgi:hypothetical protein